MTQAAEEAQGAPRGSPIPGWWLWAGLFAGPLLWTAQLLVSYAFVTHACYPGAVPLATPANGGTRGVALGSAAVALAGTAWGGLLAWRGWRGTRDDSEGGTSVLLHNGEARARFMAFWGVITSALFAGAVLITALPVLVLGGCG